VSDQPDPSPADQPPPVSDQPTPDNLLAAIRACHADQIAFGIAAGYKGTPEGRKKFGRLHREIVRAKNTYNKCSLIVPRGHAKSTLESEIGTAHDLVVDPGDRILLASAETKLAKQLLGRVRDILAGDLEIWPGVFVPLKEIFPWAAPVFGQGARSGPCETLDVVGREGTPGREPSVFVSSPGSNLAGRHPRRAKLDDPTNETTSTTPAQCQKAIDFVDQLVPLMYNYDSPIFHIGTPWAFWDICAYLGQKSSWHQIRYGVLDGPGGTPLCPSFLNEREIAMVKEDLSDNPGFFEMQYMCVPSVGDSALFTQDQIEKSRWPSDRPLPHGQDILLVDPVAVATGESLDRNGLIKVRVAPNGSLPPELQSPHAGADQNIFIPYWAEELRGNADTAIQALETIAPDVDGIWIEDVVFSGVIKPWLRDRGRIEQTRMRRQKIPNKKLDMRLSSFPTALRKGLLRFGPRGYHNQQLLESRLTQYPKAAHDDLPAALALLAGHLDRRGPLPLGDDGDPAPINQRDFGHVPGVIERMSDTSAGNYFS